MLAHVPVREGSTSDVGNEAGGFRISSSPGVVTIVTWGYWAADVAAALGREAAALGNKLTPAITLVLDAEDLKPQGADGQGALRLLFHALSAIRFAKGTAIARNVLTRMQLARLLRECGMVDRIEFVDSLP